jgi:uncharacterized membrane protein
MEFLRIVIRWSHAMAGVAWVGGGLFHVFVLYPALAAIKPIDSAALRSRINQLFRDVVQVSMGIFVITGGVLVFDRLSQATTNVGYAVTLVAHTVFGGAMYWVALDIRAGRRRGETREVMTWRLWLTKPYLTLWFGLSAELTAIALKELFDLSILS